MQSASSYTSVKTDDLFEFDLISELRKEFLGLCTAVRHLQHMVEPRSEYYAYKAHY